MSERVLVGRSERGKRRGIPEEGQRIDRLGSKLELMVLLYGFLGESRCSHVLPCDGIFQIKLLILRSGVAYIQWN